MKRIKKEDACDGKTRHAHKAQAVAHKAALVRGGAAWSGLRVYRCRFCQGGWHVGHKRHGGRR